MGFQDMQTISEMFGELNGYEKYESALLERYHRNLASNRNGKLFKRNGASRRQARSREETLVARRGAYEALTPEQKLAIYHRSKAWRDNNRARVRAAKKRHKKTAAGKAARKRYVERRKARGLATGGRKRAPQSSAQRRQRNERQRARYVAKGRPPGRPCKQLSDAVIASIIASPLSGRDLAKLHGVTEMRISRFRKNRKTHPRLRGWEQGAKRRSAAKALNALVESRAA